MLLCAGRQRKVEGKVRPETMMEKDIDFWQAKYKKRYL
jgi:hypothetical protein